MSAKRLHPLEGFPTVTTHKRLPLSVDSLVSVQSTGCYKGFPADLTSVGSFPCVCPDVSCQVVTVTEALLTHGAAVGLVSALVQAVIMVRVER